MLKLHLIDSLSTCYTAICATNSENRTDEAYALVYRTYSVDRRRWNKHVVGLIDPSEQLLVAKFFLSPQLCRQKLVTWAIPRPF